MWGTLAAATLPYVLALKPSSGVWAPREEAQTPAEAAAELAWRGPDDPADWTRLERPFRDGQTETCWPTELTFDPSGPDKRTRAIVATTDPATLPPLTTWYLLTNLPRPDSPQALDSPLPPADLAEVVRLDGLPTWGEQSYKQVKQELGWADFMVRSDRAIRRPWLLVYCAFSFGWRAWFAAAGQPALVAPVPVTPEPAAPEAGENRAPTILSALPSRPLAADAPAGAQVAGPLDLPLALVAHLVHGAPASRTPGPPGGRRPGAFSQPLCPPLTKYR